MIDTDNFVRKLDLSEEQKATISPDVRVIEAGPGSGKTRCLMARFAKQSQNMNGGVAFLSFTNAAVDEASSRLSTQPGLMKSPNFIGTLDSFLHRFVVTPACAKKHSFVPDYLASWDDLSRNIRDVRSMSSPGAGLPLSCFLPNSDGDVKLVENLVSGHHQKTFLQGLTTEQINELEEIAARRIIGLCKKGVLDSSTARHFALQILTGADGEKLIERLQQRFSELLIDESQDCDEFEHQLIELLSEKIPTVLVADPDQAIFEFRGSTPKLFADYKQKHQDSLQQLQENYRSSVSICAAVTSLREACDLKSTANTATPDTPIAIIEGTPKEQRTKFLSWLEDLGGTEKTPIVLAHRQSVAAKVCGDKIHNTQPAGLGCQLSIAVQGILNPLRTPDERKKSIQSIERVLLQTLEWPGDEKGKGSKAKLELISRDRQWLRIKAAGLLSAVSNAAERKEFAEHARNFVKEQMKDLDVGVISGLGSKLKSPRKEFWDDSTPPPDSETIVKHASIHQSKGKEYESVLVAVPNKRKGTRSAIEDWDDGVDTEQRRVLYVGASRAQKYLAFGTKDHADQIAAILTRDNVQFKRF